jgi:hypothetical protein
VVGSGARTAASCSLSAAVTHTHDISSKPITTLGLFTSPHRTQSINPSLTHQATHCHGRGQNILLLLREVSMPSKFAYSALLCLVHYNRCGNTDVERLDETSLRNSHKSGHTASSDVVMLKTNRWHLILRIYGGAGGGGMTAGCSMRNIRCTYNATLSTADLQKTLS